MKVKELIKILQKLPQEDTVIVEHPNADTFEIVEVDSVASFYGTITYIFLSELE